MDLQIRILTGSNQGDVYLLDDIKPTTMGRGREAHILITDPTVSRIHCQIRLLGDHIIIRDLGSRSGILIDGRPITEQNIKPMQTVEIGNTRFIVEPVDEDAGPTLPPMQKSLLASQEASKAAVTKAKIAPVASPPPILPAERLHELSGQRLSHFQVGPLLAKGQSGVIFEAADINDGRRIALKVLWPEFTLNEQEVQRFIRAMKTMLPVNHVNLVRIFGAGRSGSYCWLSMELVEGHSLAAVAERLPTGGKIAWKNVLRIAVYITRGLEYAHGQNILHRNVTPRNILIGSRPDICKLSDLMLAKAMDGPMAEQLTTSGQLLGDVTCMSPERTTGDPENMDERSDIYSLGASLYTAICGQPLFASKSPIQTLIQIRQDPPPPPRSLQPNLPPEFEHIILKMLAKRPEQRYASATELRHVLENFADANGVEI